MPHHSVSDDDKVFIGSTHSINPFGFRLLNDARAVPEMGAQEKRFNDGVKQPYPSQS
jgi:hypothetical protein